jgi:hypothetical protein
METGQAYQVTMPLVLHENNETKIKGKKIHGPD